MKVKCYDCKHCWNVAGSHHSSCNHPITENGTNIMLMLEIMATGGVNQESLKIKASHHGIQHGWVNYPLDFDPIWIDECTGFEQR